MAKGGSYLAVTMTCVGFLYLAISPVPYSAERETIEVWSSVKVKNMLSSPRSLNTTKQ